MSKFQLGQVMMTAAVADHFGPTSEFVMRCLNRHRIGDWGDNLPAEDIAANNSAIGGGARLLSFYTIREAFHGSDTQLWIVTESDRSCTTILFPSDY